jgi:hypothetical protein
MLRRRSRLFALPVLAASVFAMAACGDDDPAGISGDAVTFAEAQVLALAFFQALDGIDIPPLESVGVGPAQTPYGELYPDDINSTNPCPAGGSSSVQGLITGDVDEETGEADIDVSVTVDFNACNVPTSETVVFTLNGAPDVGVGADIVIMDQLVSIDVDFAGAVGFLTSDGRTGTCGLDFTISASASEAGVSQGVTGSACGIDASGFEISLFD